MDIEEFEKRMPPSAKRSRLEPFRSQIFALKAKGYADWQVKEWLAANGLEVSRQAVQQFIKKGEKGERVHAPVLTTQQPEKPAAAPQGSTPSEEPAATAGPAKRITTPGQIRQATKRDINLTDYNDN